MSTCCGAVWPAPSAAGTGCSARPMPPRVPAWPWGSSLPIFGMLSIFAIAIAAVLVYDTVSLSVEERRRDLAIVGALGGRSRTVIAGTMIETGVLGLVGGVLGGAGALVLARPITASM